MRTVLFITLLFFAAPGFAQENEKIVHGTLASLDLENGTIKFAQIFPDKLKTLNLLKKDIPVTDVNGQKLKLEDLRPKRRLVLKVTEADDVVGIVDETNLDWGVVIAVKPEIKEFTAIFGYGVPLMRVIRVTPDIEIVHAGKPHDFSSIRPASALQVTLNRDRKSVRRIATGVSPNPYCRLIPVSAFFSGHDPARKTFEFITLTERYRKIHLSYDEWTLIRYTYSS